MDDKTLPGDFSRQGFAIKATTATPSLGQQNLTDEQRGVDFRVQDPGLLHAFDTAATLTRHGRPYRSHLTFMGLIA